MFHYSNSFFLTQGKGENGEGLANLGSSGEREVEEMVEEMVLVVDVGDLWINNC